MSKYEVNISVVLSVDSKDKRSARKAVKGIPWDDLLYFDHPRAGFIKEFSIRSNEQIKIKSIVDIKDSK